MDPSSLVSDLPHIGPSYEKKLAKLGINTIKDLLYYVPSKYIDFSKNTPILHAQSGEVITIKGELKFIKNQYTKSGRKMQVGEVFDKTGSIKVVWFNQPFLTRVLYPKDRLSLAGKIDWIGREKVMISPDYEKFGSKLHTGRLVPVYPETAGLSSKWLRVRIHEAIQIESLSLMEYLPKEIISKYHLMDIKKAIATIHYPKNLTEAQKGRERFAFEELLRLHLMSITKKTFWAKNHSIANLNLKKKDLDQFVSNFNFQITKAQKRCIGEILKDMVLSVPMNRLLEGDVGSGKTLVAVVGMLASFKSGFQSIFMAPTQILALQHYETLKDLFFNYPITIGLVTGTEKKTVNYEKTDILVGTHALLNQKKLFKRVGFVVIDEQQKFGVEQRNLLIKNAKNGNRLPHVLTMTATPIPRTIALTLYGDMDLSILDEMPKGRIRPTTWLVPPEKRGAAYDWIDQAITRTKTQVFIVYPLIDDSDSQLLLNIKAVTTEYVNISKIFKNRKVGLLHGRLKNTEKEKIVNEFKEKIIDVLVTTSVIEVGIDIPNVNIIVVDSADRFGLSQLHQLRGRVGRGIVKSYCLLLTENSSDKVFERLQALKKAKTGFELSELDLKLRGPGEIFGVRQHGFPELKVASWQDVILIKASKEAAINIFNNKKLLKQIKAHLFYNGTPQ